ncbi:MAG: fumarate hydratase [Bacilli bacterium]|nr:fumarate hydratase [Bacilli bacterium]MBN2696918.1 fumarate hydratase [Bacilli bacterium]
MAIDANINLDQSVVKKLKAALKKETDRLPINVLENIISNQDIARNEHLPICQDTGIAVFLVEIGYELSFEYDLEAALTEGIRQAYIEGYLRKSVVDHPLKRKNTLDNTPPIIHMKLVVGDQLTLHFAPKGAGSENMSRLAMLTPGAGKQGVVDFVLETVRLAGGKPCPPIIIGVGIGGNFEKSALIAKEALFRPLEDQAEDPVDRELESELLEAVNNLDIGPMALGGKTTCLAVKVNSYPCHIASLPVACNIQCHAARKTHVTLKGEHND